MADEEWVAVVVDDAVHTVAHSYCDDPECWCHFDVEYHSGVQYPVYSAEDVAQAYRFYQLSWSQE